jgi:hypothetical protein
MTQPPAVRAVRRIVTRTLGACVVTALAGCLSVPAEIAPMCESTVDCDGEHGEVCEEGVCWGNPPAGMFAAVISPPSNRRDAVPRELLPFTLSSDGWMGELRLDPPALLNGRIVAFCPSPMTGCDATPLAATVTVSRPSLFRGGPGFKTIVNVEAGAESFSIPVPAVGEGEPPYTMVIAPDSARPTSASPSTSPAERVPPLRMQVTTSVNAAVETIQLGGDGLPVISGNLSDALGRGLSDYQVVALGRWDLGEPAIEASTVDYTDANGNYAVTLADGLVGAVELVARPAVTPGTGTRATTEIAPTIRVRILDATQSSQRNVVAPVDLGTGVTVPVVVTGVDLNGKISNVRGAVVSVSGVLTNMQTSFTISDEQVTDDKGQVMLRLLDGAGIVGSYRLSVAPPASSTLSAALGRPLLVTAAPTEVRLGARIALRGVIQDSSGNPLNNVAITARPSLRFLWSLDVEPQAFVSALPVASAVTQETGEFVIWVDSEVDMIWGRYDLMIEPPTTALSPTYIASELVIPRSTTLDAFSVGALTLPDAAYVHGQIVDSSGGAVEGAELKLYLVEPAAALCSEVKHAPPSCPIPAQLQGRDTADSKGTVRLVLPRALMQ